MPELIDALDEKRRPTGQRKTREELVSDGDWRNVIHILIVNSVNQLLVQQRSPNHKAWNNKWDVSVGGTVSAGDTPEQTAPRELTEELGLEVKVSELKKLGVWDVSKRIPEQDNKIIHEFSHSYLLLRSVQLDELVLQKEEVTDVDWRSLSDMRKQIQDDNLYKNWVPHPRKYYFEVLDSIEKELQ
jgi:isopentenyl-diphosphate delta-isomerase